MSQILPFLVDLRKMLSLEDPPVEEVVEGEGLAPRLVELLRTPNDEIQIEAAWCVCMPLRCVALRQTASGVYWKQYSKQQ